MSLVGRLRTPVLGTDGELWSASAEVLVRTEPLLNPKVNTAVSQPAPVRLDARAIGELWTAMFSPSVVASTVKN
jgi:hypothetical protein